MGFSRESAEVLIRRVHSVLVVFFALLTAGAARADGGIVMDGTVGTSGFYGAPQIPSVVGENPTHVTVSQSMGTTVGANLFHSFSEFNIARGQTVLFSEDSTGFINNVIARVTGHDITQINGTLRVTPGGHANFYLLNPNGVIFGNGAQIDVPGDFHVTTASFLKFKDGAQYGADPVTSRLSSADPAAFGFAHGASHNNVMIAVSEGAHLASKDKAIDLVGANITIEKGTKDLPNIVSPDIRLVAAKSGHEVSVIRDEGKKYLPLPDQSPTRANAGEIRLENGGRVFSISNIGGRVGLWGANIQLINGSSLIVANAGSGAPGVDDGIHLLSRNISVVNGYGNGSLIVSQSISSGKGADIYIRALNRLILKHDSLLNDSGGVATISISQADSGNIFIDAGSINIEGAGDGRSSSIQTGVEGGGVAGDIWIRARNDVVLANDALIGSTARVAKQSGNINLNAGGDLVVRNGSAIFSESYRPETSDSGDGRTGDIKISADNIRVLQSDPHNMRIATGVYSYNSNTSGRIGNIDVIAKNDIEIHGPYVYSETGPEDGGKVVGIYSNSFLKSQDSGSSEINVRAGSNILIRSQDSDIPREAKAFTRFQKAEVKTGIYARGNGESNTPPSSIKVSSGGRIDLRQALIGVDANMSDPINVPTISLNAIGRVSLNRSNIGSSLNVSKFDALIPSLGVSIKGDSILFKDSYVFTDTPGKGIYFGADRDIFISSRNVRYGDGAKGEVYYNPDLALYYNGFYGSGKISINAGGNLTILNSLISASNDYNNAPDGAKDSAALRLEASAESIVLSRTISYVSVKGSAGDLNNSDVSFKSAAVFPLFNVLNSHFYTLESGEDLRVTPEFPLDYNNLLILAKNGRIDGKVSLSGALFGVSGVLAELRKPAFGSRIDYGACQTLSNGQLSLSGKGGVRGDLGYLLH